MMGSWVSLRLFRANLRIMTTKSRFINFPPEKEFLFQILDPTVYASYRAVLGDVMQRLHDIPKNGCVGDYVRGVAASGNPGSKLADPAAIFSKLFPKFILFFKTRDLLFVMIFLAAIP